MKNRSKSSNIVYELISSLKTLLDASVEIVSLSCGAFLASKGYLNISEVATFSGIAIHAFGCIQVMYYNFESLLVRFFVLEFPLLFSNLVFFYLVTYR